MKIREAFSKKEELDFLKKEQTLNPPYKGMFETWIHSFHNR